MNRIDRYQEHLRQQNFNELVSERDARQHHDMAIYGTELADPRRIQAPAKAQNSKAAPIQNSTIKMPTSNDYGHWTDSSPPAANSYSNSANIMPYDSPREPTKKSKKTGAMRWLNPDWSVVRWVKNIIYEEDELEHSNSHQTDAGRYNNLEGNDFGTMPQDMLPQVEPEEPPIHAIAISSIFSFLVTVFGLYLCVRVMLPNHRFERNSNLTVFYLMAFSFLLISVIPFSNADSEVVFHFNKRWDHQPTTITGVCTEVFRLASVLFHLSSITNLTLLTVNRKFKDQEKMQQWASFLRELNIVAAFVCLAFLVPLRQDFDWYLSMVWPFIGAALCVLMIRPDSKLEIVLNLIVLLLGYLQLTQLFILAVFVLNLKVFQFGYKKTKYVKTTADHSLAWAKTDYQDAQSYLNATLDCTQDGDTFVTEQAIKREIRSYGIISILEERVEYIGTNSAQSFVLFDASNQSKEVEKGEVVKDGSGLSHLPVIERSELATADKQITAAPTFRELLSDNSEPPKRGGNSGHRARSKSPKRQTGTKNYYRSTQDTANDHMAADNAFSSSVKSQNGLI